MTLSPRDDEPDDHASRAEASDAPSEPVDASPTEPAGDDDDGVAEAPGDPEVPEVSAVPDAEARAAAEVAAWEAIVANYGAAPAWEDPGPAAAPSRGTPHPDHPAGRGRRHPEPPRASDGAFADPFDGPVDEPEPDIVRGPEERFVPPPPPPLPRTSPARGLAWFGLLGIPAVVLVLLVVQVALPTWVGVLFTAWFVGGFAFLVAGMRTDHDDPDDGAVV